MTELNYGLNLQMFAEPTDPVDEPAPAPVPTQSTPTIDYDKLAEMIEKRSSKTEESVLKGFLKSQGLSQEELNAAVQGYKDSKASKAREEQEKINNILAENKKYKQAEIQRTINEKAKSIAKEVGAREDRIGSLLRLCDSTKFVDDKGVLNEEGMKAEIEEQLKAIPEFKAGKQVRISAGTGSQNPSETTDEDEYFKRKYGKNKYFKG